MRHHYTHIELVTTDNHRYLAWGRRNKARRHLMHDGGKKVDTFESVHQSALRKWEYLLRGLLCEALTEEPCRILAYRDSSGESCFREIDFVAKTAASLVFCEIKHKDKYKTSLSSTASGWRQLVKSTAIAERAYSVSGGLCICVDMSPVYQLDDLPKNSVYLPLTKVASQVNSVSRHEQRVVWINSMEVAELAVARGWLTAKEVENMATLYQNKNDPLAHLIAQKVVAANNPFAKLKGLFPPQTSAKPSEFASVCVQTQH